MNATTTDHVRHVADAQGREWHVYERVAGQYAPMAGRPSLIFDSDGMVRRLWRYPAAWETLDDRDLVGLMDTVLTNIGC